MEFRSICPEVEIGLGTPRDPVRLVRLDGTVHLVQPSTGPNLTDRMSRFAADFLDSLSGVDGFILKSRSPSCGIKDTKIYASAERSAPVGKSAGVFGAEVLKRFPDAAVEDEGRLRNLPIREHFLTRLYTAARFRVLRRQPSPRGLVAFHTRHKYLLMAYNQVKLRELGRVVAEAGEDDVDSRLNLYQGHLSGALARRARYTSNINVLMHAFGYVSEDLSSKERGYFLDLLDRYRVGRLGSLHHPDNPKVLQVSVRRLCGYFRRLRDVRGPRRLGLFLQLANQPSPQSGNAIARDGVQNAPADGRLATDGLQASE